MLKMLLNVALNIVFNSCIITFNYETEYGSDCSIKFVFGK